MLNLPSNVRIKHKNLLLSGVIPGPVAPKDISPFLMPVTDDLITLFNSGISVFDEYKKENFTLKAMLLFSCADYPGHSKINLQHGAGAIKGCMKCFIEVCYIPYHAMSYHTIPYI